MSLFGTMSLFGSAGTLFYIVLSPFVNKSFSIQWRRGYLILNIVEYLFPFPYYFSRYKSLLKALRLWPFPERQTEPPLFLNYTDQVYTNCTIQDTYSKQCGVPVVSSFGGDWYSNRKPVSYQI